LLLTLVSPPLSWSASWVFVRHAQASLATAEWLESRGFSVQLKWPNDLYLNGLKLGGFLTEAYWHGGTCARWFLGIGINVTQAPEGCAWLPGLELDGMAEQLADLLSAHLESPVGSDVLDRYATKLLGWRQLNLFRDRSSAETFAATPKFLSPDGRLGIQLEHGSVRWVGHKELEWLVGEGG
jgi:biotin-(acetyl-CoA carboxylase) ligase